MKTITSDAAASFSAGTSNGTALGSRTLNRPWRQVAATSMGIIAITATAGGRTTTIDPEQARARVQRNQAQTRLRALELQIATEITNAAARKLYDSFTPDDGHIRYRMQL